MNLPSVFLLQSFTEFVTMSSESHPDKDNILKRLQQFNAFVSKNQQDPVLAGEYLSNINLNQGNPKALVMEPCILQEIPLQTIKQANMSDEKYMVLCHKGLEGLGRAILIGMMISNEQAQFTGNHSTYPILNQFIQQFKKLEISDILESINTSKETKYQIETFCTLSNWLLTNNKTDEHLNLILQQNQIYNYPHQQDQLSIQQVIQLLYLLQISINTDICTLVQIQRGQNESRILSFNSRSNTPGQINILVNFNDDGLNYNLIVPSKRDVRKYIQNILGEMNKSSNEIMDIYGLSTLQESSHYVDVLCSQLRNKAFYNNDNMNSVKIEEPNSKRECMICRKSFSIDNSNFGNSISHFCDECKQAYLKK